MVDIMRKRITIYDGMVCVPSNVQMLDFEIAHLLGVTYPLVRGKIATLLKSRHFGDCSDGGTVRKNGAIVPDYFGLEMVVAIAMQVESYEAEIFRKWVLRRLIQPTRPIYININNSQNKTLN